MTECYFTPKKDTTSATICANCGKEKMLHTMGEGDFIEIISSPTPEVGKQILFETLKSVLLMNREVAIRNDTDKNKMIVSVSGFNKLQNIKWCHSYDVEKLPSEGDLAHIIHLLNQRITL